MKRSRLEQDPGSDRENKEDKSDPAGERCTYWCDAHLQDGGIPQAERALGPEGSASEPEQTLKRLNHGNGMGAKNCGTLLSAYPTFPGAEASSIIGHR